MLIFGLFFTIGRNINNAVQSIEKEQGMQVFMEYEAIDEEINKLKEEKNVIQQKIVFQNLCGDKFAIGSNVTFGRGFLFFSFSPSTIALKYSTFSLP